MNETMVTASDWCARLARPDGAVRRALRVVYGLDPSVVEERRALIRAVVEKFLERFGDRPLRVFRSPGRLNLRGMHVDTHGGYINLMTHQREVVLAVTPEDAGGVTLANVDAQFPEVTCQIRDLAPDDAWTRPWQHLIDHPDVRARVDAHRGDWGNYVKGVMARAQHEFPGDPLRGLSGVLGSDLPRGAALSSSAAVCMAVLLGVLGVNGKPIEKEALIGAARDAEWYTGSRCGLSDQTAMVLAGRGTLVNVLLTRDGDTSSARSIPFPEGLRVLVVNSYTERNLSAAALVDFTRNRFAYSLALAIARQELAAQGVPETTVAQLDGLARLSPAALADLGGMNAVVDLLRRIPEQITLAELRERYDLPNLDEAYERYFGTVPEDLIQCIWFGGHHKRIVATDDGRRIEVLSPGGWNVESGPDFRHAELMVERRGLVKGDVELHVFASDWARHGHDKDAAYDAVVLHVCLRNDTRRRTVTNSQGIKVPQLSLEKFLTADLAELRETIPQEQYPQDNDADAGACRRRIQDRHVDEEWLGRLFDLAGDERMLGKARRFQSALQAKPFDQVLYEGLMEGLGYKSNSAPCLQLARTVTLAYLRSWLQGVDTPAERALVVQAALFGVAGLLEERTPADADDETRAYVEGLHERWAAMHGDFVRQVMDPQVWQFAGSRPVNYPTRRITAMSQLLATHAAGGLGRLTLRCFEAGAGAHGALARARAVVKEVTGVFTDCRDPYWDHRCRIGGKRLASPKRLIGKDRCAILIVNVLVPILMQYAREHAEPDLEKRVHAVFARCGKLPPDSVTRFMARRIFGTDPLPRSMNTARRQQGLHQLYQDFCKRDDTDCGQCVLMLAIESAGS